MKKSSDCYIVLALEFLIMTGKRGDELILSDGIIAIDRLQGLI